MGADIWYEIFLWTFISSIVIYSFAAGVAFFILRKHKFGRFYSLCILITGLLTPLTLGVLSSAAITFVYKTSSFGMESTHAMMWGMGQTAIHATYGYIKFAATL